MNRNIVRLKGVKFRGEEQELRLKIVDILTVGDE